MRVILLHDVPKVGQRSQIVDVSDGYAQNFLIPRGLADMATKEKERALMRANAEQATAQASHASKMTVALQSALTAPLKISAKANEQGHLFAGIGREMIARVLSDRIQMMLDAKSVALEEPIRTVGDHVVNVVFQDHRMPFTVRVIAEQSASNNRSAKV